MYIRKSDFQNKRLFCSCGTSLLLVETVCSSVSRAKALKKTCLRFVIFNFSEILKNIFEIGLKKYGVIVQKFALEKKVFRNKEFRRHDFIFFMLN